jgi:uncharacterized protein YdeI (YjbR/CyaY-like superfamily)
MGKKDKRVDAYISKAQDFAKPILIHLRNIVHETCPDVEETMKWSMPFFDYKGMMCHMASFKQHCVFGFWKAALMKDPILMENAASETSMGHLGKITSMKDLPSAKKIKAYLKEAMKLNDDDIKLEKPKPSDKKQLEIPEYLTAALKKNKEASASFNNFSYSNKKEYIEWLTDAKTEATRLKRLETAIEWMNEGKIRNWKYVK